MGHGINEALYYFNGYKQCPVLTCSCGWTSGWLDCWRDAGEALDEHLANATEEHG